MILENKLKIKILRSVKTMIKNYEIKELREKYNMSQKDLAKSI